MQSDLLLHITGLFSGKGRRRTEALITPLHSRETPGGAGPISERLKDKFRRRSDDVIETGNKNTKQDVRGRSGGIHLLRAAQMDFKLNLKKINFSGSPPAVPVRHFIFESEEDFPPPIPERKCSLDTSLDEEFQGRFIFHPISTVPLPEPFSNCKKIYPSKTPRRLALQRPLTQPPPPPPPVDFCHSPTGTNHLAPHVTPSSPPILRENIHSFTLSPKVVEGSRTENKIPHLSLYSDVSDVKPDPPSPPSRPLPPPPQSATKNVLKLSTFTTAPMVSVHPTAGKSPQISTKQTRPPQLTALKITIPTLSLAESDAINDSETLPTTPPFSPPPPPLPIRPSVSYAEHKAQPANGVQDLSVSKPAPSRQPSVLPPPALPAHVVKKYKELPKLPVKTSENSTVSPPDSSIMANKGVTSVPPTANGGNKKIVEAVRLPSTLDLQHLLPPRTTPPLPPDTAPPQFPSSTPLSIPSSGYHPNKHRPLPSIPVLSSVKKTPPPNVSDGWGGVEVFDPREEEGDLYDVMDSTDM